MPEILDPLASIDIPIQVLREIETQAGQLFSKPGVLASLPVAALEETFEDSPRVEPG